MINALYQPVHPTPESEPVGTGWLPPLPDLRDWSPEHEQIATLAQPLGVTDPKRSLPAKVDLRPHCSPVENQGRLGSCTAHAAVGVVEYFERVAHGRHREGSRLFVYKATRNLMGVTGDTGAWLRNAMGALALCGVPEERYWPYRVADFDVEPPAFVYAVADNYEALRYFCHDPVGANRDPDQVLASVKRFLAARVPAMFGFFGFDSADNGDSPGAIPLPCPGERARWGHAVAAVGYDDDKRITNRRCNRTTTGALLIRNSWGRGWGEAGYGWLPYDYVRRRLAMDFWSLLSMAWVDSKQFGL